MASGLLVLLIGRTTRLSRYVTGLDKSYVATAVFGAISDTLDADGEITVIHNTSSMLDEAAVHAATKRFTGLLRQTPPMASAIKVGGERLYKAHRRSETIERGSRPVTVHDFKLLALKKEEENTATFAVSCSSGTYVRTLISDLASSLGTGAYLTALRRTQVGHLSLQDASNLDELAPDTILKHIIPSREVVVHLPAVEVSGEERSRVCNGRIFRAFGVEGSRYRVEADGELLAIYRDREGGVSRAEVVLCAG